MPLDTVTRQTGGIMTRVEVPVDFERWPYASPALDRLGPFWRHRHDPLRVGFAVEPHQLNARGYLHAGVIATIADAAIGHALAAGTEPPTPLVTVSLTCDYLGAVGEGAWIDGHVTPTRVGRRLATGQAQFTADDRLVATARGLYLPADRPPPATPSAT
jgi:uncharacterized protein (TIGR00369 family)